MLLVDDDHPEVAERGEDRRSRPHRDSPGPAPQLAPSIVALSIREAGVEHGHLVPEVSPKARYGLGCQGDLGDEHDRRSARGERLAEELDVDQRLSGASDPLKEEGAGRVFVERRSKGAQGGSLIGCRREIGGSGSGRILEGITEPLLVGERHESFLLEAPHDRPAESLVTREAAQLDRPPGGLEQSVRFPLAAGASEDLVPLCEIPKMPSDANDASGLHGRSGGRHGLVRQHPPRHEGAHLGPHGAHRHRPAHRADPLRSWTPGQPVDDPPLPRLEAVGDRFAERHIVCGDIRENRRKRCAERDA